MLNLFYAKLEKQGGRSMDKSFIVTGLHYGEHMRQPEHMLSHIKKYGKDCKLAMIRTSFKELAEPEIYYEWARYFKENKIYFGFLYTHTGAADGRKSHLSKEIVENLYEIAGEYFVGDSFGELGCSMRLIYEAQSRLFGPDGGNEKELFGKRVLDMQEARDNFVRFIGNKVKIDEEIGIKNTFAVESHTLQKYGLEAGLTMSCCELLLGNPDHILSFTRGAARGFGSEEFGTYVAHEWYGGVRHDDPLKEKRLGLIYKSAFLAGSNMVFLESGYECTNSYGAEGDENHPYCQMVREETEKFNRFINEKKRLARGPITKIAFVNGHLDGYAGHSTAYGGVTSSVWGQHSREEWGYGPAEHSYKILDDVYRSCDWHFPVNYGDADYSNAPAYGQYDVLPAEASAEVMKKYDWLIFTGWNTMTEEIYENLKEYVASGGNLLISAAHMKTSVARGSDGPYIHNGRTEDFLGCNLTGRKFRSNKGYKFARESIASGLLYPGAINCETDPIDPIGSDGYTNYAVIEEKGCKRAAFLSEWFFSTPEDYQNEAAALVENKYGKGNVLFMCTDEYPGAPGVFTLYKLIVKSILTATHRNSDIKVLANDKVRFAVYEDDTCYRVYLLNTDMNFEQRARVSYKDKTVEKVIYSTEIDYVDFEK